MTYKRGGESNHNVLPSVALDVAFRLPGGEVSRAGRRLSKFARLMPAADARVHLPWRPPRRLAAFQRPAAL